MPSICSAVTRRSFGPTLPAITSTVSLPSTSASTTMPVTSTVAVSSVSGVPGDYRVQDDFGASDEPVDFTADELAAIGVRTKEWALVGRNGNDVWAEPRGLDAGYRWPQYSVQM